jgi:hypothetical protein
MLPPGSSKRQLIYSNCIADKDRDLSSTTKGDQNHNSAIVNLFKPKAGAKHELLFNKPASEADVSIQGSLTEGEGSVQ